MLVKGIVPTEQVVDVLCDVCGRSTKTTFGTNQYGSLSADFGYGSRHDHNHLSWKLADQSIQ